MGRRADDATRKSMFKGPIRLEGLRPDEDVEQRSTMDRRVITALDGIVRLAQEVLSDQNPRGDHIEQYGAMHCPVCQGPKSLPRRLLNQAADTATKINPVNAPAYWRKSAHELGFDPKPENISALTSKYWGATARQLSVSFMENTAADLKARILSHMNAWTRTGCISFAETNGNGDVRISRGQGGYWSYLGTDVLHIPKHLPTMNLEGFTMNTPEREYRRVVRHETGHTLGFPHEHMRRDIIARIDRGKIYDYARDNFGWDRQTVDEQILTPLDERKLISGSTQADELSIMCYQLPGSVTVDGEPIIGGADIDKSDYEFCGLIYPRAGADARKHDKPEVESWSVEEDVLVDV